MFTIDQVEEILNQIAETIPEDFYRELNGGILLLPEAKLDPTVPGSLYVMGEYHHHRDMGRYICMYYGSFMQVYPHASEVFLREKLEETLLHEFTHHLESLGGRRDLEVKDEMRMQEYRRSIHQEDL